MRRVTLQTVAGFVFTLFASQALAESSGQTVMNSPGGLNNSGCVAVNARYVSHVCMDKVTVRWKIGTLLNEPTINAAASWELWSRIGLRSDNTGSPDLMRAISTLKPETQAALRKLRPIQLQFGATVGLTSWVSGGFQNYGGRYGASPLKIRFDTGRMTLSGGGFSFNTTGSPGWDKFFFRSAAPSACPATAGQATVREEAVSADEAKETVKNGRLSLSDLMICKGDFAGLSELDSVLGETCDAWQPGTQAHRECLEKKEPKKEEPKKEESKKDTAKKEKKTSDKPQPQAAKPAARLDNRQLAMLDKAIQKSVDRSSGGIKGDALDRALATKPKLIAPAEHPSAPIMPAQDKIPIPKSASGTLIPSNYVGEWHSIAVATHRDVTGRIAFLTGLHCQGAVKLSSDSYNPLSATYRECRTDCSLTINQDGRFTLSQRLKSGYVCETKGSLKADGKGVTGKSDDGCLRVHFRRTEEKDNPYKPDRNGWLPSWAPQKIEKIRRAYHLGISADSPYLTDSNAKEKTFMRELEAAAKSKQVLCGGESRFKTRLIETAETFFARQQ